jgi:hypothetical protein
MTRGALVGLAAIVLMVTEPWWRRAVEYRPRPRPERPIPPDQHRTPVQARIVRRGTGRDLDRWQP